jgi:hypothetical protein
MLSATRRFAASESGAVTVDHVVLTAAMCTIGMSAGVLVTSALDTPLTGIRDWLAEVEVTTEFRETSAEPAPDAEENDEPEAAAPEEIAEVAPPAPAPIPTHTEWNGMKAGNYYGMGAVAAPGNTGVDRDLAIGFAAADAPPGFNFDTPLIAPWSNSVVYTSNDGTHYSIDGVVYPINANGTFSQSEWVQPPVVVWNGG